MKLIRLKYILFVFLIAISGCRKDEKTEDSTIIDPVGDPTIEVTGGVTGLVVNEEGVPISNAAVMVYNKQVQTDENGIFYVNNVGLKRTNSVIHVEKDGYFDGIKSFIPDLGSKSFVQLKMISKESESIIFSQQGGIVDINEGGSLELPVDGIVMKDGGAPYSGEVIIYSHWYDPTRSDLGISMPGNLLGISADGSEVQLGTYGMIAVELESPNGIALQLSDDAKAILRFPVPQSLNAPSTIPLWSFDESDAVWIEEGEANLEDGIYIAEVSHFSFWNCDAPFPLVKIEGRLVNNGNPISNLPVTITSNNLTSGHGYTDSEGVFRGKVPRGQDLILSIVQCDETISSHQLGPFEADSNVGDIEVDFINFATVIKGRMVGCLNEPLQSAYGLVKLDGEILHVITPIADGTDADGTFSTVISGCQSDFYSVEFIDPENINESGVIDIINSVEINDLGDVRICDDLDEYIIYSVDGDESELITEMDVYLSNESKLLIRGKGIDGQEEFDLDVFAVEEGNYSASSVAIRGFLNSNLGILCGDIVSNYVDCQSFNVTITNFGEYVTGSFSGTLISAVEGSMYVGAWEYDEFIVEGTFRVKIDEWINTGEISGRTWFDRDGNSLRDIDENDPVPRVYFTLIKISGDENDLFPSLISSEYQFYKFTNLLPGVYVIRANIGGSSFNLTEQYAGNEDIDNDFVKNNFFETDEIVITSNENKTNVDIGFVLPESVSCDSIFVFGCIPEITIQVIIDGGVPPYTAVLNSDQTSIQYSFPDFILSSGGDYFIEVTDAIGNTCSSEGFIPDYNNQIYGLAWSDESGATNTIYDQDDTLIEDVEVTLKLQNGEFINSVTTNQFGNYTFRNIPPGEYYLEVTELLDFNLLNQDTAVNNGNDINPESSRSDLFTVDGCNWSSQLDIGFF